MAAILRSRSAALAAQRSATLANEAVTDGHTQAERMSEITLAHPNPCERLRSVPGSSSELQNLPEAAHEASRSFSVSEKLAHYGSSPLSRVEHLTLLLGKKFAALALIRHFGSLRVWLALPFRNYGNSFRGVRLSPLLPH